MKEKVIGFLRQNRGGIALSVITFVISFLGAVVTAAFGGGETAIAFSSVIWGSLILVSLNSLTRWASFQLPVSIDTGIVGIIIATALSLIIF